MRGHTCFAPLGRYGEPLFRRRKAAPRQNFACTAGKWDHLAQLCERAFVVKLIYPFGLTLLFFIVLFTYFFKCPPDSGARVAHGARRLGGAEEKNAGGGAHFGGLDTAVSRGGGGGRTPAHLFRRGDSKNY